MARRPKRKFSGAGLNFSAFLPQGNKHWINILREMNALGVEIVEFTARRLEENHWALLILPKSIETQKKNSHLKHHNKHLNDQLERGFTKSAGSNSTYWVNVFEEIEHAGFYIPQNDIKNVNPNILKSQLHFSHLISKYFPFEEFFYRVKESQKKDTSFADHLAFAIWIFALHYARYLSNLKDNNEVAFGMYGTWFSDQFDFNDFYQRLPSEQITMLLLNICESHFSETEAVWKSQHYFRSGCKDVVEFCEQFETDIRSLFESKEYSEELADAQVRIGLGLKNILLKDYDKFLVQEILDDSSGLQLYSSLRVIEQFKYGPKSLYNLGGVVKDKLFFNSKIGNSIFKGEVNGRPRYIRSRKNSYIQNVQYWFDLIHEEHEEIIDSYKSASSLELQNEGEDVVNKTCNNHWLNLMNLITAPHLYWTNKDGKIFPQWNLFEDAKASSLRQISRERKKEEEKQRELLQKHLDAIKGLNYVEEIVDYQEKNLPVFSVEVYQRQWQHEISRMMDRLRQKEQFLDLRMEEFGISDAKVSDSLKRMWLTEILRIEEEICPYVAFVKKAFQTALPIRRSVTFSKYRHVSDGVEFDPDTLYDHEKWIRANIMKQMESKIERGEAIQINTFCLDFSGSMEHDRMRNLFKILYLLVLGLEDRKSFDAFHFFSDKFIEVVDFSDAFTNKKVLYKIINQISKPYLGKVHFTGLGGTNMSEGIAKSHEKMKNFISEFREKYPEANIVTSIFVITDGEPTLGITNLIELNEFIEAKRKDGDVEIKGIFIEGEEREQDEIIEEENDENEVLEEEDEVPVIHLMEEIFGKDQYVETADFNEAVSKFVAILTETYKQQRKAFKWKQKKRKLGLIK